VAALARFLSCSGEKAFHFFSTLRKNDRFMFTTTSEFDITFVPRGCIKAQVLADFMVELLAPA
jgi:hypothetical protein